MSESIASEFSSVSDPSAEPYVIGRILWPKLFKYVGQLIAIPVLISLHLRFEGYHVGLLVGCAVLSFFGFLSLSVGYHRLFTHKSFKAVKPLRFLLLFFGAANQTYSALKWANFHRRHHKYCDHPLKDPYPATRGLAHSHITWLFKEDHKTTNEFLCKDLLKDELIVWQHRNYKLLLFLHQYLFPLLLGFYLHMPLGALAYLGLLKTLIPQQLIFSINSLGHYWGTREHDPKSTATDHPILGLITMGEGYHNYHHAYPNDYRLGAKWYDFDFSKWFIWCASKIGLTSHLKRMT